MIVIPVRCAEPAAPRGFFRSPGSGRDRDPLDGELAERHLELLDDLRPLVGAAEDRAELARLVVLELEDCRGLLVARVTEDVELAGAVEVLDDGHAAAVVGRERELRPDSRQARLSQLLGHSVSFRLIEAGRGGGRFASTPS